MQCQHSTPTAGTCSKGNVTLSELGELPSPRIVNHGVEFREGRA
jgi:hypothetical protein